MKLNFNVAENRPPSLEQIEKQRAFANRVFRVNAGLAVLAIVAGAALARWAWITVLDLSQAAMSESFFGPAMAYIYAALAGVTAFVVCTYPTVSVARYFEQLSWCVAEINASGAKRILECSAADAAVDAYRKSVASQRKITYGDLEAIEAFIALQKVERERQSVASKLAEARQAESDVLDAAHKV